MKSSKNFNYFSTVSNTAKKDVLVFPNNYKLNFEDTYTSTTRCFNPQTYLDEVEAVRSNIEKLNDPDILKVANQLIKNITSKAQAIIIKELSDEKLDICDLEDLRLICEASQIENIFVPLTTKQRKTIYKNMKQDLN
jgi:hypothetical protein